jgi:hypothetical protein
MRPVLLRYSAVQSDYPTKRRRPEGGHAFLLTWILMLLLAGAGPAGNYPLSKQIGELDFSIVSTYLPCGPRAPEVLPTRYSTAFIYNWAISKEEPGRAHWKDGSVSAAATD